MVLHAGSDLNECVTAKLTATGKEGVRAFFNSYPKKSRIKHIGFIELPKLL